MVQHYISQDGQAVVKEHINCLAAKQKLPSYILENNELTELSVKSTGDEDWSQDVCLSSKHTEHSTVIQVWLEMGVWNRALKMSERTEHFTFRLLFDLMKQWMLSSWNNDSIMLIFLQTGTIFKEFNYICEVHSFDFRAQFACATAISKYI